MGPCRITTVLTVLTIGALLAPAPRASAEPVIDGQVSSAGTSYGGPRTDCGFSQSDDADATRQLTSTSGRRTARTATTFTAVPFDGIDVAAHGRVETATSGVVAFNGDAFDHLAFTAHHLARVVDDRRPDCGMRLFASSLASVSFVAERRGRVRLAWDRGAKGTLEWVRVSRDGARVYERTRPRAEHDVVTFRLRRGGTYSFSIHFRTRVSERATHVGGTLTKRSHFRVVADYLG
jgi:hypothetical protein